MRMFDKINVVCILKLSYINVALDSRLEKFKEKMDMSIEAFSKELTGIRAGRATTALLEPIKVDAYGSQMPLNQVGTISAPDARLLAVNIWDKGLVKAVEKAIRECGANLNPMIDGKTVKVPIPPLSDERRQELSRLAAKYAEAAKVAIRNIRRDANEFVKTLEKNNEIGEDESHKLADAAQNLTNDASKKIDELLAKKQKDITQI